MYVELGDWSVRVWAAVQSLQADVTADLLSHAIRVMWECHQPSGLLVTFQAPACYARPGLHYPPLPNDLPSIWLWELRLTNIHHFLTHKPCRRWESPRQLYNRNWAVVLYKEWGHIHSTASTIPASTLQPSSQLQLLPHPLQGGTIS